MTGYTGLTRQQVRENQVRYGNNLLRGGKRKNPLLIFLSQFKDLMTLILLCATGLSWMMGETTEALTIIAIVILNGMMGFFQEYRTERSLEKLNALAAPTACVIRDGRESSIPAREVTIQDVVKLTAGDRVPADCRIVENQSLMIDESLLTGESVPVEKDVASEEEGANAFMGTIVSAGHGIAIVTEIGEDTRMGEIAVMLDRIESDQTPLQKKLDQLGRMIAIGCLVICSVVAGVGIFRGEPVMDMIVTGISLAVAAIPEGLPAIVTIALALSVNRMVKKNAVIRRLHAVETLGCANVICSDKTGTLTENKMTVKTLWCPSSSFEVEDGKIIGGKTVSSEREPELQKLLTVACICNNASLEKEKGFRSKNFTVRGEPTEAALMAAAARGGVEKENSGYTLKKEIAFDSSRKMMSVLVKSREGKLLLMTKGAPEILLERCGFIQKGATVSLMTATQKQKILQQNQKMAKDAMRVIALCWRNASSEEDCEEQNLVFCGLAGMTDPPRKEAFQAVKRCQEAGIRTVMITGDNPETARAVAGKLHILKEGEKVLTGAELDGMQEERFLEQLPKVSVFARVTPSHKLRIVKGLKAQGNIVAMTGDGVNDAPAVKEANIGVSMGKNGTDVTKEASSVILLDDNFSTLVSAVEEGRVIYQNIRKFIRYLLSCNIGEVITMFAAMLMGMPVPLLPIQILLVNLVTDGLPAIALGLDPADRDVMRRSPRKSTDSIFAEGLMRVILFRGALIGLTTVGVFSVWLTHGASLERARTAALMTLVLTQLVHVFECKSETKSLWRIPLFNNLGLVAAALISLGALCFAVWHPVGRALFSTVALVREELYWIMACVAAAPVLWAFLNGILFGEERTPSDRG